VEIIAKRPRRVVKGKRIKSERLGGCELKSARTKLESQSWKLRLLLRNDKTITPPVEKTLKSVLSTGGTFLTLHLKHF
jgi:hypothetical protein